jgi:hypothetical protein
MTGRAARYQEEFPTGNIVDGSLWVDKGSVPLKMYIYDASATAWKEIGA